MRNRVVLAVAFLFFLVPESGSLLALPPPARDPNEDPKGTTGALKEQIQTGGSYSAYSGNGTRNVRDLSVPDALGEDGLNFTRYWNSVHNDYEDEDAEWPTDFGHSGWSHSWKWNAIYTGETIEPEPGPGEIIHKMAITITFPDAHTTKYKIVRSSYPQVGGHDPDDRLGPDYTNEEITMSWPEGGMGVDDHLTNMAVNGSEFWLSLADGGSVHFVRVTAPDANQGFYRATEVFDPHGLRTELFYTDGYLTEVRQEGGRSLYITWGAFDGGWWVITKVETGGTAGFQQVIYKYTLYGHHLVLAKVAYENDPAPGQMTNAYYTYGNCFGEGIEPCNPGSEFPLLKRADDPRYAGAMTKIRYTYWGGVCPRPEPTPPWQPPLYVPAQPYAIAAEKSDADPGDVVSSFQLDCDNGERMETNGFGAKRMFYFGSSANTAESGFFCRGFQLGKVTDFYYSGSPADVPNRRQNFDFGDPRYIWDGRNIKTEEIAADDSGSPSEVHHVDADGSSILYNRLDESLSETPLHPSMHNSNKRWLFRKTDENNQTTVYRRDSRRRIKQIDYQDGSHEFYTYNNFNQVETHTLPSEAVQTYVYNALHQLVLEYNSVDGPDARKEYTYDSLGRVLTMTDGRARNSTPAAPFTVRMTYNGRHQVLSVEYPPTGGGSNPTVRYEYDKYGNCTAIINELGHRSTYTYDAYRRCTSYTEPLDAPGWNGSGTVTSRRWDWIYDRYFNETLIDASAHTSRQWRVQIEPAYNPDGPDVRRRLSAHKFDYNDRIIEEATGLFEDANGGWHSGPDAELHYFSYDENGQKKTYTDPLGRVTTYGYDPRNRLETTTEPKRLNQTEHPVTRIAYDEAGNKKVVTFPDARTQKWDDYDAFGQAWKFTSERNHETHLVYKWGPMKKLDTVKTYRQMDNNAGTETQLTDFDYDGMGRPTRTLFPDLSSEVSTYEFGQLKTWKTRRNPLKTISYDARGRETSHTWDDGMTSGVSRGWDDANRLLSITNNVSAIYYQYDSAGQVLVESSTVAGSGPTTSDMLTQLSYCRFPSGEVSRMVYPNGSTIVNRFYTARGQLQGVGWGIDSTSYVYHPDGKVHYQVRENDVTTSYVYDGRGMIGSVSDRNASDQSLAYREYWRDDRDRITAWKRGFDSSLNGMEDGRGDRYRYDDEGQLDLASYRVPNPEPGGTPGPSLRSDIFSYDELGNRQGSNYLASRGEVNFTRKNNGLNQYSGWTSEIKYDDDMAGWGEPGRANGVMMEEGWIRASFNALNQPMAMWSPVYSGSLDFMWFGYDPLGRCVKRWISPLIGGRAPPPSTNPATYYYYDGWNMVQEGSSGNSADRVYVHGGRVDEIVASEAGGKWVFHHYDAQGNCIMLTSVIGGIQEQYDYDAFGFPYFYTAAGGKLGGAQQWGNRFLFTGREWLQDLRIYDFRARQYHPELGRFLQPDPIQFKAGDYNLYRYCHNDPVNGSDPFGLISDPATLSSETMGTAQWEDMPAAYRIGTTVITGAAVTLAGGYAALAVRAAVLVRVAAAGAGMAPAANKLSVQFGRTANQISHTFRHTDQLGLGRGAVQTAVRNNLSQVSSQIKTNEPFNKVIEVGGQKIQYTAYKLPDGTINVGRIHELAPSGK